MNKKNLFLTLTGFQLTWLACIFGEKILLQPLLGFYVGLIYLSIYFYFCKKIKKLVKIMLLISIPGYFFDTFMVFFSIYEFNYSIIFGTIPIWMVILWLSYSTLYYEVLIFFKNYKIIGIILSSLLGPLTYYSGFAFGYLSINNIYLFFIYMILFWALLMIYYIEIILKRI